MDGWAQLGAAFGGDSEKSYQEGLALGAKTEDALAQARERVEKNAARARLETDLIAGGASRNTARAASTALTAGAGLTDPIQMMLKQQEHDFRAQMGDPNVPIDVGQRAALGVAEGPVEPIYKVGNRAFNKFKTPENIEDLGAVFGGDTGSSSFIQAGRAFGVIGPDGQVTDANGDGRIDNQDRALAYEILRNTDKQYDIGGVPQIRSGNPFGAVGGSVTPAPGAPPQGPAAAGPTPAASAPGPSRAPLATVQEVAGNAAAIASAKQQGEMQAKAVATLPDTLADVSKFRAGINDLLQAPGYDAAYGNWQGTAPGALVTGLASQDATDAQVKLTNLGAQSFGIAIEKMKTLGQLSNMEGQRMIDAYTTATNPKSSPEASRAAWATVLTGLDAWEQRARGKAVAAPVLPGGAAPDAGGWQNVNGIKIRVKPQ